MRWVWDILTSAAFGLIVGSTALGYFLWRIRPRPDDATRIAEREFKEFIENETKEEFVNPVIEARDLLIEVYSSEFIDKGSFDRLANLRRNVEMSMREFQELWSESCTIVGVLSELAERGNFIIAIETGQAVAYLPEEWPPEKKHD